MAARNCAERPLRHAPTAAGALAAFALGHGVAPAAVRSERLAEFRRSLIDEGVPLAWPIDAPFGDPSATRSGATR